MLTGFAKVVLRTVVLVLGLAIASWSPASRASADVAELLRQAEQVRSADPVKLRGLMSQLNADANRATPLQQQQISYLNAYAQAIAGNLDESIRQGKQLIARTRDPDIKFRTGALIVNNFALNGRYNEGLRQLEQTIALVDEVKDPGLREHGLISAATLYNQIGQYQLGRHYADKVIAAPSSQRSLCFASYYKFDALLKLHELPEDDASLFEAISTCAEQHETMMANLIRATLARKWVAQGQRDRAVALLQQHLAEAQSTGYPRVIAEVRSILADLLFAKGDLAGAETNARATVEEGSGILNTPPVVSALLTLYEIADRRGDVAGALAAYKRYAEAERGYLEEVKARELAFHLVRQEARQKNQQIELLNRQNSLLQLQQRVDQQKAQNSRLLMLFLAVFTLLTAYWAYKTRRLHASLRHMAETDALTGICNRHHFTLLAEKTLAKCATAREPVALVMFDLDHFKLVNDTYGHSAGDWVLRHVAETCKPFCRGVDHIGRLGGEEFAILLHGLDLKSATRVAEDCRVRISQIDSTGSGFNVPVTASFGVSSTTLSGYDLDRLLSHADQMLYRAKRAGRNSVRAYVVEVSAELNGHALRENHDDGHPAPSHAEPPGVPMAVPLGRVKA